MKKLLILLIAVLSFADIKLLNKKIENNKIIIEFEVDAQTFKALKSQKQSLLENTKKLVCKNPLLKELTLKYSIIYEYKYHNEVVKAVVDKKSCQ